MGSRLDHAAKLLGNLKRKTEEDTKYIKWSFMFFLSVVAYIVLKRLKVFRLMYLGASWTMWSGASAASFLQRCGTQLVDWYRGFCQLVGIPSMSDSQIE